MNVVVHQPYRAARKGLPESLYRAPAIGRSAAVRAVADHDAVLFGRWVAAPQGTLLNAAAVRGVFLTVGESVEWVWTHTAKGSFVSGYHVTRQKVANLKSHFMTSSWAGATHRSSRSKARR